jgi:hypothetical protein
MITQEERDRLLNPSTPAESLRKLYKYRTYEERAIVYPKIALHPNTPLDVLIDIFEHYPLYVLQNPAFPLILIEESQFFQYQSSQTLLKILLNTSLPTYIFPFFLHHSDVAIQITAKHHVASGTAKEGWEGEILQDIVMLDSSEVERKCLVQCQMVPQWLLEIWQGQAWDKPDVSSPAPLDELDITPLSQEEKESLLHLLESNRGVIYDHIRQNNRLAVLEFVIQVEGYPHLRAFIASYEKTPPEILNLLFQYEEVWTKLAKNPRTPQAVLRQISTRLRYIIPLTSNPNTPVDVLQDFVKVAYKSRSVADRLFKNHNITQSIWEELLPLVSFKTKHLLDRRPLQEFLDFFRSSKPSSQDKREMAQKLLYREDTPLEIKYEAIHVSYLVFEKPLSQFLALSQTRNKIDLLPSEAKKSIWWVRLAIATNPCTEKFYLEKLSEDTNRYVRAAARARLENPNWRFEP